MKIIVRPEEIALVSKKTNHMIMYAPFFEFVSKHSLRTTTFGLNFN